MKPLSWKNRSGRIWDSVLPAIASSMLALVFWLAFAGVAHPATNFVTSLADHGAGSLRQVMADSAWGDFIQFDVSGTIVLTSGQQVVDKSLNLVGPGVSTLAVSGNGSSRIFYINPNVTVSLVGLTLENGRTADGTGGIAVEGGGAIYNAGTLRLDGCAICFNHTGNGENGSLGQVAGGVGGSGGSGAGIFNAASLTLINSLISTNSCGRGGSGGSGQNTGGGGGGGGWGGGIYSLGRMFIQGCTLAGNIAGSGGDGGNSGFSPGSGGYGGNGGGLYVQGILAMTDCTIAGNWGGYGGSGGLHTSYPPGSASSGPGGSGGGIDSSATNIAVVSCTIVSNAVGVNTQGGGIHAWTSPNRGGYLNNLIARNTGPVADVAGEFHSLGHNLIGVTNGSSGFTAADDLTGSDAAPCAPKVAALADNGGPTLTLALLPGSPAIDAGAAAGTAATDQRGIVRPQGPGVDMGAFEYQYIPIFNCPVVYDATNCQLQMSGLLPNQLFSLEISSNLLNWVGMTNFVAGTNGMFEFIDPIPGAVPSRFYRLKSVTP